MILEVFQQVLKPGDWLLQTTCNVAHFLSSRGPHVVSVFQYLGPEKLEAAQQEFTTLEAAGIVR